MGRGGSGELAASVGETLGNFGEFHSQQGGTRGENEIKTSRHECVVLAIEGAKATLGQVAMHGIANRSTRSDDAHTGGTGGISGSGDGTSAPCEKKGPAINAAPLLSNGAKIFVAPQPLAGAETHLRLP
jgi:hypothetical protein